MPRPPKRVREALKASGEWDFEPSPPPFDPVAAFCAGPDEDLPIPGAFHTQFDPTTPLPPAYFENGPLFGEIPEDLEELFSGELPSPDVFQALQWDGAELTNQVTSAAYIASAVQIAVAHSGVGFGRSRLLDLSSRVVKLPEVLSLWVETLGEFVGPDDRQWLYRDFPSATEALVRAAVLLRDWKLTPSEVRSLFWLPTRVDDGRTAAYVAVALSQYLSDRGFQIPESELVGAVFSGTIPPTVCAIAQHLPSDEFTSLKLVFQEYSSDRVFLTRFSSGSGIRALGLLGLEWDQPRLGQMMFFLPVHSVARRFISHWQNIQPTVEKGLGVTFRTTTYRDLGDPWQVMRVHDRPGGVEVLSYYSLTEMVANFRSSFGSPLVYSSVPMKVKAIGRIDVRAQRISLLRNHFGLDGA